MTVPTAAPARAAVWVDPLLGLCVGALGGALQGVLLAIPLAESLSYGRVFGLIFGLFFAKRATQSWRGIDLGASHSALLAWIVFPAGLLPLSAAPITLPILRRCS